METPLLVKVAHQAGFPSIHHLSGFTFQPTVDKPMRKISATEICKRRMQAAKAKLPEGVGQLAVIRQVVQLKPDIDRLTNLVRWKNAYSLHVADPELTDLVESAVAILTGDQTGDQPASPA